MPVKTKPVQFLWKNYKCELKCSGVRKGRYLKTQQWALGITSGKRLNLYEHSICLVIEQESFKAKVQLSWWEKNAWGK